MRFLTGEHDCGCVTAVMSIDPEYICDAESIGEFVLGVVNSGRKLRVIEQREPLSIPCPCTTHLKPESPDVAQNEGPKPSGRVLVRTKDDDVFVAY